MTVSTYPDFPTTTLAVNPTATELYRWRPSDETNGRCTLENLDNAQTINGWIESRAVAGSGNFYPVETSLWSDCGPGGQKSELTPDSLQGAAELRFMATSSGAGCNCKFTRTRVYR